MEFNYLRVQSRRGCHVEGGGGYGLLFAGETITPLCPVLGANVTKINSNPNLNQTNSHIDEYESQIGTPRIQRDLHPDPIGFGSALSKKSKPNYNNKI